MKLNLSFNILVVQTVWLFSQHVCVSCEPAVVLPFLSPGVMLWLLTASKSLRQHSLQHGCILLCFCPFLRCQLGLMESPFNSHYPLMLRGKLLYISHAAGPSLRLFLPHVFLISILFLSLWPSLILIF